MPKNIPMKLLSIVVAGLALSLGGAWVYHGVANQAGIGWLLVAAMLIVSGQIWALSRYG